MSNYFNSLCFSKKYPTPKNFAQILHKMKVLNTTQLQHLTINPVTVKSLQGLYLKRKCEVVFKRLLG